MEYNEDLIRALAHGEKEAQKSIEGLPLSERMSIGVAVDKMRTDERIVPMTNNGIFAPKEQRRSNHDVLAESLNNLLEEQKRKEQAKIDAQEKYLEQIAEYEKGRARLRLARR